MIQYVNKVSKWIYINYSTNVYLLCYDQQYDILFLISWILQQLQSQISRIDKLIHRPITRFQITYKAM